MCVLRIKGRFKNYSVHASHSEALESDKDAYYELLGKTYDERPAHDIKIVIGDLNAKVGKEEVYRPTFTYLLSIDIVADTWQQGNTQTLVFHPVR